MIHKWKEGRCALTVVFTCERCGLTSTATKAGSFCFVFLGSETHRTERYRWLQIRPQPGSIAEADFVRAPGTDLGDWPLCLPGPTPDEVTT